MEAQVPKHIGFIMDGNGRWAKKRNLPRVAGHIEGLKALKRVICACRDLGVPFATFYVFSTENWKRSPEEVGYLMNLLSTKLHGELSFYLNEHISIRVRGDRAGLPPSVAAAIAETEEATKDEKGITCCLAVNYGGQDEICRAVTSLAKRGVSVFTPGIIRGALDLPDVPPVDIIVRSAGEQRLSNFLLWDSAYAELASYDKLWPDWTREDVIRICDDYALRVRKFGGVQK